MLLTPTADRRALEANPSAHVVNPCVTLGLESHLEPVRHERLYRIALRIIETHKPYHDDNVGTQSAERLQSLEHY